MHIYVNKCATHCFIFADSNKAQYTYTMCHELRKVPHHTYFKLVIREQGTMLDTKVVQFATNSPYSQSSDTNKYKRTVQRKRAILDYLN